ncbi:DsbA family protein [Nocardia brasiliensis]
MNTSRSGWPSLPPSGDRNRTVLACMVAGALLFAVISGASVVIVAQDLSRDFVGTAVAAPQAQQPATGQQPAAEQQQPLAATPANVTANGAIQIGDPAAKNVVQVVADLQCPACQAFEQANATALEDAATRGSALIEYNIISFLDRASTTQYSSRAGNAAYCVAEADPAKFQGWLATMFEQQPAEGGAGLPDTELIAIAQGAGYTESTVAQCITDRRYDTYLRTKSKEIIDGGIRSTPTVLINNHPVADPKQLFTPNGLAPTLR